MANEQQENINTIFKGYYEGTQPQHAKWREVASFVYANALRDLNISSLALKTTFEPLQKIAASANFSTNAKAVTNALTQPFVNGADSLHEGGVLSTWAQAAIKLANDPFSNIKGAWSGVKATREATTHLAEHATGIMSLEERNRLAEIYDLPFEQRIQALHGVTLTDTAAMVSVGSLPGLLPNALTKAKAAMNEVSAGFASGLSNLPVRYGTNTMPVLAGAGAIDSFISPQMLAMTSKGTTTGGSTQDSAPVSGRYYNEEKGTIPDDHFDWYRMKAKDKYLGDVTELGEHLKSLGFEPESKRIKKYLDHMLDVRVIQTAEELNMLLTKTREIIDQSEIVAFDKATASGMSKIDAFDASRVANRKLDWIEQYVQEERVRNFEDLRITQEKYLQQQHAKNDSDTVGYHQSVEPRDITDREMNHHLYLIKFQESTADLKVKLELLGLQNRADFLDTRIREMLVVTLEDSKSLHQQRVAEFMNIEEEAKAAVIEQSSYKNISAPYFKSLQEGIGADLAHIRDEISQDRDYHIRHQL